MDVFNKNIEYENKVLADKEEHLKDLEKFLLKKFDKSTLILLMAYFETNHEIKIIKDNIAFWIDKESYWSKEV